MLDWPTLGLPRYNTRIFYTDKPIYTIRVRCHLGYIWVRAKTRIISEVFRRMLYIGKLSTSDIE